MVRVAAPTAPSAPPPGPPVGRRRRAVPAVAAVAAGVPPVLAFPRPGLWWLAFVALVPLGLVVRAAPSARQAALRGWLGGAGFCLAMYHWLLPSVGPFALPLALLLGAVWAPWGLVSWSLLRPPVSARRLAAAMAVVPGAWVVAEVLRSWERLGGPWALLGTTQWQSRAMLPLAAVGGVWALSFVVAAANVATTVAVAPGTRGAVRAGAVGAGVVVALAGPAAGALRHPLPVRRTAVVVGVQPGVVRGAGARFRSEVRATRGLAAARPDLVVWGESSVGFDLAARPAEAGRLAAAARAAGADVMVNVDARRGRGGIFKSTVLVGSRGPRDHYDKMRLVPFGEYVPFRPALSWVGRFTDAAAEDRRRGRRLVLLRSGRLEVGPLVCFESAFPDLARHLAAAGADLIVVQTATTTFQGSWAQPQHASLAAVRAVETGRPVVHAALSGVSAAFDAEGHRLAWVESDRRGTYSVTVPVPAGMTPYVRLGDWVPAGSALVVGGWAVVAVRSRRRPGGRRRRGSWPSRRAAPGGG